MSSNQAVPRKTVASTVRRITVCAMLCALSVILARLIIPMPNDFTRFSVEAVPVLIAGMFFGPLAGAMVGFSADLIGCLLFSAFGYNPIFCLPPILYGLAGGFFGPWLKSKASFWRVLIAFAVPVVLGSVLWQSLPLAYMYGKGDTLWASYLLFLSTRSVQFAITLVLDVVIVFLLQKSGAFKAAKLQ